MFIPQPTDLNKEQWDAVNEPESILLIACPGSGKTRTLTYKIAMELSRLRNHRDTILAITYTNAAAEEIKERIDKLGAPTEQLWIGTIHSFCLEWILRPYALYHDSLKFGFTVLNASDTEALLDTLCQPYRRQRISHYDCDYFADTSGFVKSSEDQKKGPFIDLVLAEYWKTLLEKRQVDFEQILWYSYQLINNVPAITTILSKLFPYVLVDEYQDTKEIQYEIILSILREAKGDSKLMIVGDPNQSIYESLGGYPMEKSEMEKKLGFTLKQYSLSGNYRSSKIIIDYFDAYKTFDNKIAAVGAEATYPSLITYDPLVSHQNLSDAIVNVIRYNIETNGIEPNEICIAAARWWSLASLSRDLMVKLPHLSFDGPGMAPFARDNENFWFKVARILLTEPSPDMYLRRLRWASEILQELNIAGLDFIHLDNRKFLRTCNGMNINETEGIEYLEKGFSKLMELLQLNISSCNMLQEHHTAFFESSKRRIRLLEERGAVGISSLDNFKNVFRQKGGIKISTIHGVKGTEFDVVIGFALLDSWVPYFGDRNGDVNAKKMMYVLSSRAKKNLHLFSETGRQINNNNPEGLLPTPCLAHHPYAYRSIG